MRVPYGLRVKVKIAQLCLTLCDSMDYSCQASPSVALTRQFAIPFSRGFS